MLNFDSLKAIGKVLQEAGKIEQYKQILEVQEKLLEQQERITQLQEENITLKEKKVVGQNIIYKNKSYWIKKGEELDGPFCSRCWDKDSNLLRIHENSSHTNYLCPECKTNVYLGDGSELGGIKTGFTDWQI